MMDVYVLAVEVETVTVGVGHTVQFGTLSFVYQFVWAITKNYGLSPVASAALHAVLTVSVIIAVQLGFHNKTLFLQIQVVRQLFLDHKMHHPL
jgi:hypothetical protein